MQSSFTFLRVRGIPIGANWTWLLVFALVAWSLGSQLFPRTYPGLDNGVYLAMGFATSVLFFLSILLHELGHAFRALDEGMEIDGITLWVLGGVARFRGMFPSPGAEARIAIAGPGVTLVLALGFAAFSWIANAAGWPAPLIGVSDYLARINGLVLGFNLVPALPLDGGRVLRAYLWDRQRSFTAATLSAAKAGRAFGMLLIGVGVLGLITGSGIGGMWFAFIGWFLLQAAQMEAGVATLRQALGRVEVSDLMTPDPQTVRPDETIQEFVDHVSNAHRHSSYPVVDTGGHLVGLMQLRLAAAVPHDERAVARIADVMLPREQTPTVDPHAPVVDAIERLQEGPGRAVVMANGDVTGILSASDVARALELETLRVQEREPGARRAPWFVWIVVGVIMALAAAYLYHPPVAVLSPGPTFDVTEDIAITGTAIDEVNGEYLMTSVALSQPSALGLAISWVKDDQILPLSALLPEGIDTDEYMEQQRGLFQDSRRIAAAAAARLAGMDVTVSGEGAEVKGVAPGSPAAGVLERGDVIRSVNGETIDTASDLSDAIRSRPQGTRFTLSVRRAERELSVDVRSRRLPDTEGAVIGVLVETVDLDVDLPFDVRFEERDVGGPSAGSAYAAAIADMLDDGDYARGRTIALTGTISLDGDIGPVGGVDEKADAANRADADLFLVPAAEVELIEEPRTDVRGVRTLADAIAEIRDRQDA